MFWKRDKARRKNDEKANSLSIRQRLEKAKNVWNSQCRNN